MKYSSLSEKELISLSQDQDTKAFEELERRNRTYVYNWILSRTRDANNADEVYQTMLIKCWKGIRNFRFNSTFKTWANRIALNAYRDRYRKYKREDEKTVSTEEIIFEIEMPTQKNKGFENLVRAELREDISQILGRIPNQSAKVLIMHLVNDMSYREIARTLKCPIGTVMSRMFYARKNAREAYNYI